MAGHGCGIRARSHSPYHWLDSWFSDAAFLFGEWLFYGHDVEKEGRDGACETTSAEDWDSARGGCGDSLPYNDGFGGMGGRGHSRAYRDESRRI